MSLQDSFVKGVNNYLSSGNAVGMGLGAVASIFSDPNKSQKDLMKYQNQLQTQAFEHNTRFNNQQSLAMMRNAPLAQVQGLIGAGLAPTIANGEALQSAGQGSSVNASPVQTKLDLFERLQNIKNNNALAESQVNKNNADADASRSNAGLTQKNIDWYDILQQYNINYLDAKIIGQVVQNAYDQESLADRLRYSRALADRTESERDKIIEDIVYVMSEVNVNQAEYDLKMSQKEGQDIMNQYAPAKYKSEINANNASAIASRAKAFLDTQEGSYLASSIQDRLKITKAQLKDIVASADEKASSAEKNRTETFISVFKTKLKLSGRDLDGHGIQNWLDDISFRFAKNYMHYHPDEQFEMSVPSVPRAKAKRNRGKLTRRKN